jgi:hypothetical protein
MAQDMEEENIITQRENLKGPYMLVVGKIIKDQEKVR